MLTDQERDALLAACSAERVTKEGIEGKIAFVQYFLHDTTTIAVLTLKNGFAVVGEAGCASPANFNEALGQKIAYDSAFSKCWALEGYLLREALFLQSSRQEAA